MFQQIVSRLSFSPATVAALATYAAQIRRRHRLRIYSCLVLGVLCVLQLITVVFPLSPTPQAALVNPIRGGLTSHQTVLSAYDTNVEGFGDTSELLSITRTALADATPATLSDASEFAWVTSRGAFSGSNQPMHSYVVASSPLYLNPTVAGTYQQVAGWQGTTTEGYRFFISSIDGAIFSTSLPAVPESHSPFTISLTPPAGPLQAGDEAKWQLAIHNPLTTPAQDTVSISVADLREYAHITTSDDGFISQNDSVVSWPLLRLEPGETQTRSITATMSDPMSTAMRHPNGTSYDCLVSLSDDTGEHGTPVACPWQKHAEFMLSSLPTLSPTIMLGVFVGLFILSLVLLANDRLLLQEIRIIRKQLSTGSVV